MDCANFAAVFSPAVKPGISKTGVKKQETLFPDFLFRIFASNGGYPVVILKYNYVVCLCLSGSFSVKTELEQGSDKPLFDAVLGVCVDISVLKGGKPDSSTIMPQNLVHGFRVAAGRPDNGFIRNEFRIPHAKALPFSFASTLGNSQPLKTPGFQYTPLFLHLHFSVDF